MAVFYGTRGFWLYTILRNDKQENVYDSNSHPVIFLKAEKELGKNTILLFALEISQDEYLYATED